MPELPEVECLMRSLRGQMLGREVSELKFFRKNLRTPIPARRLTEILVGQRITDIYRRSKYIIMQTGKGNAIVHLGMTGNILAVDSVIPKIPHTHVVWGVRQERGEEIYLHFVDPRRFGLLEAADLDAIPEHKLFKALGPEPLLKKDLGEYLFEKSRKRQTPIKNFLMDAKNVVGVGNIYASESLYRTGIRPTRKASKIKLEEYLELAKNIKIVLKEAIKAGGTTLKDYKSLAGEPGYFRISLDVYDRKGEPCNECETLIKHLVQAGRSSYYCPSCQK